MSNQAIKRQVEEASSFNDNLNDEELDVTWGGKRSRFIYNYVFEIPDSITDSYTDSEPAHSIHSIETTSTVEALSEPDISENEDCDSSCNCQNSSESDHTEFEVVSSSSSENINNSYSSDSSTILNYKVIKNIINNTSNTSSSSDIDDTDNQITTSKSNLPPPACFKSCLQCGKENPNPYFQYCFTCFRYRMEFFESKPDRKPKSVKSLNMSICKKKENFFISVEQSDLSDSQDSITLSQSSSSCSSSGTVHKYLTDYSKNDMFENTKNICNICYIMPKNGVFNHGKIGHNCCCYPCAKKIWRKTNKCPICNIKVKFITKMIVV